MCRDTVGGRIDQLANYCCYKKVTENTVANSLAAWLPFDQLSCKFENIRGAWSRPHPQPALPRAQSMKKGTSKLFKRRYSLWVLFFRSISGGNTVGGLLISSHWRLMILIANSYRGGEKRKGVGAKPLEIFRIMPFSSSENDLCYLERAIHFCLFAEMGMGLDPRNP